MIKESHYRGLFEDQYSINVDRYIVDKGLDLLPVFMERFEGRTATAADMVIARQLAVQAEKLPNTREIVITISDSEQIPENDRNAPLDGNAEPIGHDSMGFCVLPKKRTGDPGDQYYDWKPLTQGDIVRIRKSPMTVNLEDYREKYRGPYSKANKRLDRKLARKEKRSR